MADVYSYPLLVELEDGSIPKLKNKLVKYFQSKKSNGGDCQVEYENGSSTATLRFRREEDRQNVLAKESHQISLDKGVLKMTVRLPTEGKSQETPSDKPKEKSDLAETSKQSTAKESNLTAKVQTEEKGGNDDTADEELCSTSAILGNIPDNINQEFLEMLVDNIAQLDSASSSESFTLELFPDISSAAVTFQTGKENAEFVARCPQNKMFVKKGFSVQPLEVTKQVLVDDIQNLDKERLQLYFEKEGCDVEDVVLNDVEQSAVITFEDHGAVKKILKKKHYIKKEEIKVYPFYKSLGTALYGKDKPSLKLPAAISEPVDSAILKYLADNKSAAEAIRSDMEKHFCDVNLDQSTVTLSPVSSLLKQKDAKVVIKEWTGTVKTAFAQFLSKFKSLKFHPDSEVWEECEKEIRQMLLNEDVMVVPDKASGVLLVAGLVNEVNRLEKSLSDTINKMAKKVQRKKSSRTEEIKVSPSIFHILRQDGLEDRLLNTCPELKMSPESPNLKITGLGDEIMTANKLILDAVLALKRQNLEVDNYVLELLKKEQQEELTNALLISNKINAAFDVSANRVQLVAVSDKDLYNAQQHLEPLLISQYINVEDSNVLKNPEWQNLVSQLENANSKPCRTGIGTTGGDQVVVSGHKDSVIKVSQQLEKFLSQNAHVEETVGVKANVIIDYMKTFKTSWLEKVKDKVTVSYRNKAIIVSGSRVDVANCKTVVEGTASSVVFDSLKVFKSGVKKLFLENEAIYVSSIKNKTGCLVQLVDETGDGQDKSDLRQVPQILYQLQTAEGVEIAVCKADMCSYPVQIVVSPSNQDLKNNKGLSAALVKAAGRQLQDECDKIIKSQARLKPGDCVITGAGGQLCCTKVIHVVEPKFESDKPQKALALLRKAIKASLELAENSGCVSVALPSIGRGRGFPVNLCEATIVKALKEYFDEKYEDVTLQKIHFVDVDDSAVQAMEAALRQEFGNYGGTQSQPAPPPNVTMPSVVKPTGSDSFLFHVQTKDGLDIILTKGNIEASTTEVIVNTVSQDLDLDRGAVSKAIFAAAGPKLQQSINAQNASGNFGEVIPTEGCNLKSKKVFHAIAPTWDNSQGPADKILSGIFKACLEMAEDHKLTSISLPAIGTGNLGFPRDLVASLMLDKILSFSKKKHNKHLKKVVIILYPGDVQSIQTFTDEFQKRFSSTPSGSMSPPQSQGGPFSKIVSTSDLHETKMGNVTIQVVTGDITKETTDIIVNSSNEKFSLKSGVSKAILEAAGQAVEMECRNLAAEPNSGIIMTKPGNLKCKRILHVVGQSDPVKINNIVKDALLMCVKSPYTSVSFPAIGTGQGNAQAKRVADAMLDAVIEVLSQNTSSPMTTVRIVIFQQTMLKDFLSSMQEREGTDSKDKGGWSLADIGSKIKAFFVGANPEKTKKDKDFSIEVVQVDAACFHICGDTQAKVDSAKQWLDDKISKEHQSIDIEDNAILRFSDADRQKIVDMQKTWGISIRTETNKPKATITIEGLSKDVISATAEINKMLSKARDEEELMKKVEEASAVAEWQYQLPGFLFQSFDPMTNFRLEEALEQKLPVIEVTVQGQDYIVTMPSGPGSDNQGNKLDIKRIDKQTGYPESWDPMPANTTSTAFTVQSGTSEYDEILKLFQATCNRPVVKIERIQNPALWNSLQVKKHDMEKRNGHQNNEKRLFHGTAENTVPVINERGFNRSYAGANAACYGNGSYFAVDASYSARDTYSKPNQNGEKFMYICRVLTGEFALGAQGIVVPPQKGTVSTDLYDSVVDNMAKPNMFVVFHDSQAYPEYLITFK